MAFPRVLGIMECLVTSSEVQGSAGFDEFYAATRPRLVGYLTALMSSQMDAEDLAQEAYVRLLPRWDRVSQYSNPEGWLRSVAFRLAVSRWRRLRSAKAYLQRQPSPSPMPPPGEDTMAVIEALRNLTLEHRQILVLYHGLDLTVEDIAQELGVPIGTVKSRLSRARIAASQHGGAT